jgi:rhodanese-related sulfurtransferase
MVVEMPPEELYERLENGGDVQVVDIRSPRGFERGHIPGAENLPFTQFSTRIDEYEWDDEIVVVCPHGKSSQQAARLLESYEGVDDDATVANLTGGYDAWEYELDA